MSSSSGGVDPSPVDEWLAQAPNQAALDTAADTWRESFELAGRYAKGDGSALAELEQRADAPALAFAAFAEFHAGNTAHAAELRARLALHEPAVTPGAAPAQQYLELLRGTFGHCRNVLEVPDALCWPFTVEPSAASAGLRGWSGEGLPPDELRRLCVFRTAAARTPLRTAAAIERADELALRVIDDAGSRTHSLGSARFSFQREHAEDAVLAALLAPSAATLPLSDLARAAYARAAALPMASTCEARFFGLDGPLDYDAARACIDSLEPDEASAAGLISALMYVNGQGSARDLTRAKSELARFKYVYASSLSSVVEERIQHPEVTSPPLRYCQAPATTLELNECWNVVLRLARQTHAQRMIELRRDLSADTARALTRVELAFRALAEHDSARAYWENSDGTMRGQIGSGQELQLIAWHAEHLELWLHQKRPPVAPALTLAEAESRRDEAQRSAPGAAPSDVYKIGAQSVYRREVDESAKAWLAYRNAWLALMETVSAERSAEERRALLLAVNATLTSERAAALTSTFAAFDDDRSP